MVAMYFAIHSSEERSNNNNPRLHMGTSTYMVQLTGRCNQQQSRKKKKKPTGIKPFTVRNLQMVCIVKGKEGGGVSDPRRLTSVTAQGTSQKPQKRPQAKSCTRRRMLVSKPAMSNMPNSSGGVKEKP